MSNPNIYLVAGEPSGDILGDQLIKSLSEDLDSPIFHGVGGPKMEENKFVSLFKMNEITVFGIFPVLKKIFFLINKINEVSIDIINKEPDLVVLIDSPDFNHRVAKKIKRKLPNIPIVCLVAPSVWAWRHGRAKKMSKYFDHLLSIIPFEVEFFNKFGLDTTYIGHPIAKIIDNVDEDSIKNNYNLTDEKLVIFLPGSRSSEIERHSIEMSKVINTLERKHPKINVLIVTSPKQLSLVEKFFPKNKIVTNEVDKFALFKKADFACAASGTVTLELGLAETPTIVVYKMDSFTWFFVSRLVKVKFVSLVNLLLGRLSSIELLQDKFNNENIYKEIEELLNDNNSLKKQREDLKEFKDLINANIKDPSKKASQVIKGLL